MSPIAFANDERLVRYWRRLQLIYMDVDIIRVRKIKLSVESETEDDYSAVDSLCGYDFHCVSFALTGAVLLSEHYEADSPLRHRNPSLSHLVKS